MYFNFLAFILFTISTTLAHGAIDALSFVKKSDKKNDSFKGEYIDLELQIINSKGQKSVKNLTVKTKEVSGDGNKSLIEFSKPIDVKGLKLLTWSHKHKDDDQWLYLPTLNKVTRISSSNKTGSFVGSEFSYEDISSFEIEKYEYKFVKNEKIDDQDTTVVELRPKDKNSGYTRQLNYYHNAHLQPVKIEYFDRKNALLKTSRFSTYKNINGFWRTPKIFVENHQTHKRSILLYDLDSIKIGIDLDEDDFSKENLED